VARPVRYGRRWRIRWTDADGRRRSEVYDDHADAAFKLRQHQLEVEQVRRGLRAPEPPPKTFDELCDYWLARRAVRKRSRTDDESILRRHLRPAFGALRLRDLGVERVDAYVCSRAHLDKKTVANHLTLLVSMLNAAVDLGWLAKAPKIRKPWVPLFTRDFRYLRTDDEVHRFLEAARAEGEPVFALYATAIYTGLREGELAGLRWEDVDLDRRLITVQRSFDGPTKAEDVRYVPVLDPLLPVLRRWRLRCSGQIVFPNRDGGMHGEAARVFQEVLRRVLRAAGFPETPREGKRPRPYITFHGTRHTFASQWMMKGGDLFKLQKILGHKSVQMTMRYAHLAPDAFAADYGRLGDRAPGEPADVVPLRAREA
jgi:integrase